MANWRCLWLIVLAGALGCSGSAGNASARLSGAVTIDGAPVAEGKIAFLPQGDTAGQAVTADIQSGRYDAPAVPRGKVKAMITATKATGKMITEYSEPYAERVSIVPPQYGPGFDVDVAGDNLSQDFTMTSH
jgi:hypothetical protein